MFEVGFWEITLIGVIALLVIGPERLPGAARTVGLYVGRIRRYVTHVQADIQRELRADELRKMVEDPDGAAGGLREVVEETKEALGAVRNTLEEAEKDIQPPSMNWVAGSDASSKSEEATHPMDWLPDDGSLEYKEPEEDKAVSAGHASQPDGNEGGSGGGDVDVAGAIADAAPSVKQTEPAAEPASESGGAATDSGSGKSPADRPAPGSGAA